MFRDFIDHFRNARKVVEQINNDEWVPRYNSILDDFLYAARGDYVLWLGNGSYWCEVIEKDNVWRPNRVYIGKFWRYYVWFFAARGLKNRARMWKKNMEYSVNNNQKCEQKWRK